MTSLAPSEKLLMVENPGHPSAILYVFSRAPRFIQTTSSIPIQLKALLTALQPSFLQHRLSRVSPKDKTLHQTASLDGLRGLACLFVFNEVGLPGAVERSSTNCR